jgi:hypothetical protein
MERSQTVGVTVRHEGDLGLPTSCRSVEILIKPPMCLERQLAERLPAARFACLALLSWCMPHPDPYTHLKRGWEIGLKSCNEC